MTQRHASPWSAAGVRSSARRTAGEIRPATLTAPVSAVRTAVSTGGRESPATRLNQDRAQRTASPPPCTPAAGSASWPKPCTSTASRKYRDRARVVRLRPRCGNRWPSEDDNVPPPRNTSTASSRAATCGLAVLPGSGSPLSRWAGAVDAYLGGRLRGQRCGGVGVKDSGGESSVEQQGHTRNLDAIVEQLRGSSGQPVHDEDVAAPAAHRASRPRAGTPGARRGRAAGSPPATAARSGAPSGRTCTPRQQPSSGGRCWARPTNTSGWAASRWANQWSSIRQNGSGRAAAMSTGVSAAQPSPSASTAEPGSRRISVAPWPSVSSRSCGLH